MRAPRYTLPLALSAVLHTAVVLAAPFEWPDRPAFVPPPVAVEAEAELGPVNVGVYEEPAPPPPPAPAAPPIAEPKKVADAPAPPALEAEKADADAEQAPAPLKPAERKKVVKRSPRKDKKAPCPPSEDISRVADATWAVDRDLIEYYAGHIKELMKLGSVSPHTKDGKPNGFRVGLPRCSVLREGGLRSGDVVHNINGRKVNNLVQAVAAYFALRKEETLTVNLTRQGKAVAQTYHIEGKAGRAQRIRLKDLKR